MSSEMAQMWETIQEGSDELAEELDLEDFSPRMLPTIDRWIEEHEGALAEDELTRLALFLARMLLETHRGGLAKIRQQGHLLDGEWAITGFARGIANDYHLPFFVSAFHIGDSREISARRWYTKLLQEAK